MRTKSFASLPSLFMVKRTGLAIGLLAICHAACSACPNGPNGEQPGDTNNDGFVSFLDFLVLSDNFGNQGGMTWADGDFTCDGNIDFADFLILSNAFGNQGGVTIEDEAELASVQAAGWFDSTDYVILAEAVDGLANSISIQDKDNGSICFMGPIDYTVSAGTNVTVDFVNCSNMEVVNLDVTGEVEYSRHGDPTVSYDDDNGVVNVVSCTGVSFTDLKTTNVRRFVDPAQVSQTNLFTQSSCALNIQASTNVTVQSPSIVSNGKSTICIHGGSTGVVLNDVDVSGAYFAFNFGASNVTVNGGYVFTDLLIENASGQIVQLPDSHSTINLTSRYTDRNGNIFGQNANVVIDDVEFEMKQSRPLVSGWSLTTLAPELKTLYLTTITLNRPKLRFHDARRGLLRFHRDASAAIELIITSALMWDNNDPTPHYKPPVVVDYRDLSSPNVLPSDPNLIILGRFISYDAITLAYRTYQGQDSTTAKSDGLSAYVITP